MSTRTEHNVRRSTGTIAGEGAGATAPAPPAPAPIAGRGSPLRRIIEDSAVMSRRSILHSIRNIDALLIGIILPVILLVMFTYVFGGAIDTGGAYIDYIVPTIILLCAGYGAGTTAVSVTQDMTEGIVDRFRTMQVTSSAVLTGHVVASMARNMFSTALVVVLSFAFGFRPHAGVWEWCAAIGIIALFILALSWLSAAFGLLARSVDAASALSFFILFLPYVSSAFVPIATLPGWLRPIAEHQPITPIVETIRGLLLGTDIGSHGWVALAWCCGILAVSVTAAVLLWRRSRRR